MALCNDSIVNNPIKAFENIDHNYNVVAHLKCSEHQAIFPHILLRPEIISFLFFNNSMISWLCESVVDAYCLLLSDTKE